MPLDVLQGLVEGSSAHPKISCDFRFALPISDHLASESVDAVHMQRIPITEVVQASNQLWPGGILSTAFVGEDLVQVKTIELPGCVLICAADTDVADLLSFHA